MQLPFDRRITTAAVLLLCILPAVNASTITTAPKATPTSTIPATCEFRTINYITDSLPQQCLKSSWSNANGTVLTRAGISENATATGEGHNCEGSGAATLSSDGDIVSQDASQKVPGSETLPGESASATSSVSTTASGEAAATDLEAGELNDGLFLSFEEWKKQTLDKAGQQDAKIGGKKSGNKNQGDTESFQNNLDSLGDEGEIDLDFGAFRSKSNGEEASHAQTGEPEVHQEPQEQGVKKKDQYRSKDAGKTCKERFNYASFDAGATILKTHPGAEKAKNILIENKDSYMLSKCATDNKFVIIELSEDIWIDTVVLAIYEFFSSNIRTFRVSVSDRYPVKMEKWKDVGTYEARNTRDIQAFLIENPQIWARYIRIEFLSHYGTEYYCPLSLVRVHGTRMLESWKETEANGDDDESEEDEEASAEEQFVPEAVADVVKEEERISAELKSAREAIDELVKTAQSITAEADPVLNSSHLGDVNASLQEVSMQQMITPWIPDFDVAYWLNSTREQDICLPGEAPAVHPITTEEVISGGATSVVESTQTSTVSATSTIADTAAPFAASVTPQSEISIKLENATITAHPSTASIASNLTSSSTTNDTLTSSSAPAAPVPTKSQNVTSSLKNKTTTTSSASPALPTIQESFFKAVSRRLQLLETNSTLSLKYIEEQSRILRDAFTKVEKKQLQKTTTFLDTLNSTLLSELREVRQQYDQIWQSTVISLESQREESRKEILAISTRLNILADEVVFQKRMSIVQSVLLLLCLGLVIFSRVSSTGQLDFPLSRAGTRILSGFPMDGTVESPIESPPESPEYRRTSSMPERQWLGAGHRRNRSDESVIPGDHSGRDESPPTPISSYSRSEHSFTPPSGADDRVSGHTPESENLELPKRTASPKDTISSWHSAENDDPPPNSSPSSQFLQPPSSSPGRAPKKRKAFVREQVSPPPDDTNWPLSTSNPLPTTVPSSSTPHTSRGNTLTNASPQPSEQPTTSSPSPGPEIPSPPSDREKRQSFSIARKPLPALPKDE